MSAYAARRAQRPPCGIHLSATAGAGRARPEDGLCGSERGNLFWVARRVAAAPGPKFSRSERPSAERRSRPDVILSP